MRGDGRLVNIRYNDGKVKRLPRHKAEVQVELGRAQYISNTLFKAAEAGITVQEGQTDSEVKAAIRAAQTPEETPSEEKERQPQKRRRKKQKA
jgi:hypothetical protein